MTSPSGRTGPPREPVRRPPGVTGGVQTLTTSTARAEVPPAADRGDAPEIRRVVRQRVVTRRRARRRAVYLQAGFSLLALVVLVALVLVGWRSAMRITGGRDELVTDPEAPGFVAEVRPTPVDLVAVTGDGDELISMLLVVSTSGRQTAVPLSPQLALWDFEGSPPAAAQDVFADGGIDALRLRLGADLGFGTTGGLVVPGAALVQLASTVGPLTIQLSDDVFAGGPEDDPDDAELRYAAGDLDVEPEAVDDFLAFAGYKEPDPNRALRSGELWQALLEGVDPVSAAALGDEEDVVAFAELFTSMAEGDVSFEVVPTSALDLYISPPRTIHRVDEEAMADWASTHVPFPVAAYPGQLASVAVLDGTGSDGAIEAVSPDIVSAGAQISLTGNAESFDVATSRVEYGAGEAQRAAEEIADVLGVGARQVDEQRADVDVTVVVGKDLVG
jgi:hypothetical protein